MPGGDEVAARRRRAAPTPSSPATPTSSTELVAACAAIKAACGRRGPRRSAPGSAPRSTTATPSRTRWRRSAGTSCCTAKPSRSASCSPSALACALERIDAASVDRHRDVLAALDLPTAVPGEPDADALLDVDAPRQEGCRRPHLRAPPRRRPRCSRPSTTPTARALDVAFARRAAWEADVDGHHPPAVRPEPEPVRASASLRSTAPTRSTTSSATPRGRGRAHGYELEHVQSNHEGDIVDAIHGARGRCAAIVINPGAFGHYCYAIADALADVRGCEGGAARVEPRRARRLAARRP